jgi:hypothetical protein
MKPALRPLIALEDDMNLEPGELLTTKELATLLHTPPSTLRYWRQVGDGPHGFRLGRRVVYRRHDVEHWLDELDAEERRRSTANSVAPH